MKRVEEMLEVSKREVKSLSKSLEETAEALTKARRVSAARRVNDASWLLAAALSELELAVVETQRGIRDVN